MFRINLFYIFSVIYLLHLISKCNAVHHHNHSKKLYDLVVVTYFKNEAWNIEEFIEHYIAEGVEHFYMIDNGSTDEYMHIIINSFPLGLITVIRDDSVLQVVNGLQNHLIRKYFNSLIRSDANWVMVVDLDEFIYSSSTEIHSRISSTLDSFDISISRIFLLWKVFGGNNVTDHPQSLVKTFNRRAEFTLHLDEDAHNLFGYGKMIVRVTPSLVLETHGSANKHIEPVYAPIYNNFIPLNKSDHNTLISIFNEKSLHQHVLQLNHYTFQSREYYKMIKAPRGGGQSGHVPKYSVENYDQHANLKRNNLIFDNDLYLKKLEHANIL